MSTNWTRDDLPMPSRLSALKHEVVKDFFWDDVLDEVANHLNTHHPKPDGDCTQAEAQEWTEVVRGLRRERDAAVERAEQAERERAEIKAEARKWIPAYSGTATPAPAVSRADVTAEQRDAVADHLWNAMVGSAKSVVREVVAQAFAAAGIEVAIEAEQAVDPIEAKVTTRHPENYRLVNEADGSEWRMTRDGSWVAADSVGQEADQ